MERADPNTQPGFKPPAPDVVQQPTNPAEPPPPKELPQDDPLPGGTKAPPGVTRQRRTLSR